MTCFAALQLIAHNALAPPLAMPPPQPMSCPTYLGVGRAVCTKPATFCPLPMLLTKPCVYLNVCPMTCLQNVPSRVLIQERERERGRVVGNTSFGSLCCVYTAPLKKICLAILTTSRNLPLPTIMNWPKTRVGVANTGPGGSSPHQIGRPVPHHLS